MFDAVKDFLNNLYKPNTSLVEVKQSKDKIMGAATPVTEYQEAQKIVFFFRVLGNVALHTNRTIY